MNTGRQGRIGVAVIQNFATHYNLPLFERLAAVADFDLQVFAVRRDPAYERSATLRSRAFPRGRFASAMFSSAGVSLPSPSLLAAVAAARPDCILVDGLSSVGTAAMVLAGRVAPDAKVLWWSLGAVPGSQATARARIGECIQRWAVHRADGVIAYGRHAAGYFAARHPKGPVVVAPNTIDESVVPYDARHALAEHARAELKIGDRPVVFFCGRLDPWKRVDLLIEAFAAARAAHGVEAVLLIVGDGPERAALEALAARLGIGAHVRFTGRVVDEVARYFFVAQFAVLPGSGGLAINHAFAHGVPVVCGIADGTERDLVVDGETGRLLDPMTPAALAETVAQLLADPDACRTMGDTARHRITTRFSLRQCADAIDGAIRAAVRGGATAMASPREARC